MRIVVALMLVVCSTTSEPLNAQEPSGPSELSALREVVEQSVANHSRGLTAHGFEELFKKHWITSVDAQPMAAALEAGRRAAEAELGKPIPGAYEYLGVIRVGASLARLVYILKHERWVVPLVIGCYKAGEAWRIIGFSYGDNARHLMTTMGIIERAN